MSYSSVVDFNCSTFEMPTEKILTFWKEDVSKEALILLDKRKIDLQKSVMVYQNISDNRSHFRIVPGRVRFTEIYGEYMMNKIGGLRYYTKYNYFVTITTNPSFYSSHEEAKKKIKVHMRHLRDRLTKFAKSEEKKTFFNGKLSLNKKWKQLIQIPLISSEMIDFKDPQCVVHWNLELTESGLYHIHMILGTNFNICDITEENRSPFLESLYTGRISQDEKINIESNHEKRGFEEFLDWEFCRGQVHVQKITNNMQKVVSYVTKVIDYMAKDILQQPVQNIVLYTRTRLMGSNKEMNTILTRINQIIDDKEESIREDAINKKIVVTDGFEFNKVKYSFISSQWYDQRQYGDMTSRDISKMEANMVLEMCPSLHTTQNEELIDFFKTESEHTKFIATNNLNFSLNNKEQFQFVENALILHYSKEDIEKVVTQI